MAKAKAGDTSNQKRQMRPALTLESEENQMIYLANRLARQQLEDGTASSQVITHFLKLGTTIAALEKEKMRKENELLSAKTEHIQSSQRIEELYKDALNAMRNYSGQGDVDDD